MANIIYFFTIICIFGVVLLNTYGNKYYDTYIITPVSKIDQLEVQAFNSAYDSYEGDQKGSALKQLTSTARLQLVAGKIYTVSFDYNKSGLISTINIVEKL